MTNKDQMPEISLIGDEHFDSVAQASKKIALKMEADLHKVPAFAVEPLKNQIAFHKAYIICNDRRKDAERRTQYYEEVVAQLTSELNTLRVKVALSENIDDRPSLLRSLGNLFKSILGRKEPDNASL